MSRLRANQITNQATDGAPTVEKGLVISGVTTSTSFSGSGTSLTNLPSAQLTGALPAIDGSNLTGLSTPLSFRNLIINGAMQVNEHSDSNAGVNGTFAVDRFKFKRENTAANFSMTQSTTSPDGFYKSLKVDCTYADTSTAANEFVLLAYSIEARDLQSLAYGTSGAKPLVLSFYVRSNLTGNYAVSCLQRDNSSKIYARTYTINNPDTWERKTITIPADTAGVINDDNGEGLLFNFALTMGSIFTSGAISTSWETYSNAKLSAQHGVNVGGNPANEWYLTGVQLEIGDTVTPFEHRSFGDELARCQRYYQQYVNISAVGYVPDNGSRSYSHAVPLPVAMRAGPTMSITNTGSSNGQMISDGDTNRYISSVLSQGSKTTHMSVSFNLTGDLANFRGAYLIGTSSTTNQTTYKLNAEL